jgi:chromosome segregation ATPase
MNALTGMIRSLEDQLDRMLANNDALKTDLDGERKRRMELERTVEELRGSVRDAEEEVASHDNLLADNARLNAERTRLHAQVAELTQQLAESEREATQSRRLVERLRKEQAYYVEEVRSVESQFERAMHMVAELQAKLTVVVEERDALGGRLQVSEEELRKSMDERDALMLEVDELRAAIDDIRRSLTDAYVASAEAEGRSKLK